MKRRAYTLIEFLITIIIITLIVWGCPFVVSKLKSQIPVIGCQKNLRALGSALQKYAADNNGLYPIPSKWCDLLVEKTDIDKDKFCCRSEGDCFRTTDTPIDETNIPVQVKCIGDYNDSGGQKKYVYQIEWSNYGLNPNAEPNSAPNVVLLFETSNGWNQFGGPDLVSVKNHFAYGKEGCNILFNNGNVRFIKPKDIPKLNWGKAP